MKKLKKTETLKEAGYFFHPTGDFPEDKYNPKKQGIWKKYDSPIKAEFVSSSWAEAWEHFEKF